MGTGKTDGSLKITHNLRTILARAHCLLGSAHFNCNLCPAHDETTLRGDWFVAACKSFLLLVDPGDICPPQLWPPSPRRRSSSCSLIRLGFVLVGVYLSELNPLRGRQPLSFIVGREVGPQWLP
jgi:hypothetical protein